MRQFKFVISLFIATVMLLAACNPTKDKWINRNWHTMTGRFNVYFNGEIKLEETVEVLEKGHQDDFTKILEVFPYGDEAASKAVAGQLDIVLKKVSLAIQNHYVGRYTDNSYYLMGKAHYFKGDYYAAMEAFQYVNAKYKDKGLRPVSTAWIAKCYVGLGKVDEAEAVMGLLISEEAAKIKKTSIYHKIVPETPKAYTQEIYATAADIAIKQRKFVTAADKLVLALSYTTKKQDKIRYNYILGQLNIEIDSVNNAKKYFSKVLTMLAPYDFEFNASINLSKAYDTNDKGAAKRIRKSLKHMLRDDKNDGYYDQIWYALGNLELKEKNKQAAIFDFKKCAEVRGKNPNQKSLAYLALGSLYLEIPNYILAQAYYDSTASSISPSYKDYTKIIAKKTVLSDLINNLIVVEREDSLQELSKLSESELDLKIDTWIAKAKLDSAANFKTLKAKKEADRLNKLNPQIVVANGNTKGFGQQGQWYFYNPTLMAIGANEFFSQKKWGTRVNEDLWRIASIEKQIIIPSSDNTSATLKDSSERKNDEFIDTSAAPILLGINDSKKAWLEDVPFTAEKLDQSNRAYTEALYNIGVIYDVKLSDTKEAIKDFELLLYKFPGSQYEPEVLYKLYKLYISVQNSAQAFIKKSRLIAEYPESPYAQIIQNKIVTSAETDENKKVVEFYEKLYQQYLDGDYEQVIAGKGIADKQFAGNTLQPKFDLLNALAIGKTQPLESFKIQLIEVVAKYPKTDVGSTAQGILDYLADREQQLLPDSLKPIVAEFTIETEGPFYVIVAIRDDKLDMNELIGKANLYNEEFHELDNLRVNTMLSNEGYQLLMIRDFKAINTATQFYSDFILREALKKRLKYELKSFTFIISQVNFKKMLKEQKVELYQTYFSDYIKNKIQQK